MTTTTLLATFPGDLTGLRLQYKNNEFSSAESPLSQTMD